MESGTSTAVYGLSIEDIQSLQSRGMAATDPLTAADRAAFDALQNNLELVFANSVFNRAAMDANAGINPLARIDLQIAYLKHHAAEIDLIASDTGGLSVSKRIEYLEQIRHRVVIYTDPAINTARKGLASATADSFSIAENTGLHDMWELTEAMEDAFLEGDPYWARAGGARGYNLLTEEMAEGARNVEYLLSRPPIPDPGAPPIPPRHRGYSLRF